MLIENLLHNGNDDLLCELEFGGRFHDTVFLPEFLVDNLLGNSLDNVCNGCNALRLQINNGGGPGFGKVLPPDDLDNACEIFPAKRGGCQLSVQRNMDGHSIGHQRSRTFPCPLCRPILMRISLPVLARRGNLGR